MAKLRIHEIHYLCWVAQGFPSYEKLAEQLGVSVNSIKKEAQRHDWVYKRNKMTFAGDVNVTQDPKQVTNKDKAEQITSLINNALNKVTIDTPKDLLNLVDLRDRLLEDNDVMDLTSWTSMDFVRVFLEICSYCMYGLNGIPDPDDPNPPDPLPVQLDPIEVAGIIFDKQNFDIFIGLMEQNAELLKALGGAMIIKDLTERKIINSKTGEVRVIEES